jgi:hypothetical protein
MRVSKPNALNRLCCSSVCSSAEVTMYSLPATIPATAVIPARD